MALNWINRILDVLDGLQRETLMRERFRAENFMRRGLTYLVWLLAKLFLSLRYRIHIDGLDKIKGLKKTLILPNHPAYVDPPLVLLSLWPAFEPRPMLLARMFHNPVLFWLPKALSAIEVPNMNQPSAQTRDQAKKAINEVIEGLRHGKNHILWPAGRAQRQNSESLGAARSVADILRDAPDANIVVVRTRELWGSMFSYARTGQPPRLMRCLLKGMGILVVNFMFFAPRRRVHITVQQLDRDSLPDLDRATLNPFLEDWYNAPGPEPRRMYPTTSLGNSASSSPDRARLVR